MIASYICGGLGNQLFQYAMAYSLAKKSGKELVLDTSNYQRDKKRRYCLDYFNISATETKLNGVGFGIRYRDRVLRYALYKLGLYPDWQWVKEKEELKFDLLDFSKKIYLEGYWQNVSYFEMYSENILEQFSLRNLDLSYVKNLVAQVRSTNSICIHIRRGDYVSDQKTNRIYDICGKDYYLQGMQEIISSVESPEFFVFSDDIEWVRSNFKINDLILNYVEIGNIENVDLYEFYLMTQCRHHIIANSTFSWWGAWLSRMDDKQIVIYPKSTNYKFPVSPSGWQRIDVEKT